MHTCSKGPAVPVGLMFFGECVACRMEHHANESAKASERFKEFLATHRRSERDWSEDSAHENGDYWCKCHKCEKQFLGHKRRVTCKLCATTTTEAR